MIYEDHGLTVPRFLSLTHPFSYSLIKYLLQISWTPSPVSDLEDEKDNKQFELKETQLCCCNKHSQMQLEGSSVEGSATLAQFAGSFSLFHGGLGFYIGKARG